MLIADRMQEQLEREERVKEKLFRIKNKIGVHSGKGGVGKTTVAVNLAATLAKNHSTALLDADIDCPDVARFLGMDYRITLEERMLKPAEKYGMKVMSTAFLHDSESPVIMRGPMKHHALMQMLAMTELDNVEYLIIDLPPGTSDIPLTVMQLFGLNGIIAVTTPQAVAIQDTRKSIGMAKNLGIKVLGVVENMSGEIFGSGGGEKLAEAMQVSFLGRIQLDKKIRELGDRGIPQVLGDKELAGHFEEIAARIQAELQF